MCGIAGISGGGAEAGDPEHEEVLRLLSRRGPDARRTVHHRDGTFYHTRLSIIDTTERSSQPFAYEGQDDLLVYNGEIFNYRELAGELQALRTAGDVEVLYRLLRGEGESALSRLNGFFALAYADGHGGLLLARDRFGEKPLYYTLQNNRLYFASELKALLTLTGPRGIDGGQLYAYLRLNYCAGERTIFKDVYRLLPGQLLRFSKGTITKKQWYSVQRAAPGQDLFSLLDDAVLLRLRADVPVGTFLSGGLDSSVITALAARHQKDVPAFTLGFSDDPFLDETRHAVAVAKHLQIPHHVFTVTETDLLQGITPFFAGIDEPFADSSAFNMFVLSQRTKQHVKVALSGDGADELFKGYRKHAALLKARHPIAAAAGKLAAPFLNLLPSSRAGWLADRVRQAKKFARLCSLPETERLKFTASLAGDSDIARLLAAAAPESYFENLFADSAMMRDFPQADQFDMVHVLADDMLVKGDRFSMCHGLEVRNPFLDVRVAEFALTLPESAKISGSRRKIPLRDTFGHLLPPHILARKKHGFEVPVERWLKTVLWEKLDREWLNNDRIESEGIFNLQEVRRLKKQLFSARADDAPARLWALLVFSNWMDNFVGSVKRSGSRPLVL